MCMPIPRTMAVPSLRVALLLLLLPLLLPLLIHAIPHSHILPPNALLNVVHMLLVQELGA